MDGDNKLPMSSEYSVLPCIVCPKCSSRVGASERNISIPCGGDCPCKVEAGVVCVNHSYAQFGEANPTEMRTVLESAEREGWRNAIRKHFTENRSFVVDLIEDERRTKFSELLDLTGSEHVLDIGCGYGGVSAQLSKKVKSVTSLDITLERVSLLDIIRRQDDINNIQTVCNGDVLSLPFEENSFDVVLMIGVLEYFPVSLKDHSPWDAHVQSLLEVQRVLKPGGKLYLGTKNRFGLRFMAGGRDHNNVPFGPVLPLRIANFLCRRINNRAYRIISHSYAGYETLLGQSGFEEVTMHWPVQGYQKPVSFVPLKDKAAQKDAVVALETSRLKWFVYSLLADAGALKYFVENFSIVASKPAAQSR